MFGVYGFPEVAWSHRTDPPPPLVAHTGGPCKPPSPAPGVCLEPVPWGRGALRQGLREGPG